VRGEEERGGQAKQTGRCGGFAGWLECVERKEFVGKPEVLPDFTRFFPPFCLLLFRLRCSLLAFVHRVYMSHFLNFEFRSVHMHGAASSFMEGGGKDSVQFTGIHMI
jgi:hypothetical protein